MDLYVLELRFSFGGREDALHPVVLRPGRETVLVDCGYAGFLPRLEAALLEQGLAPRDLTGVIITHHDVDHTGCAAELKAAYPALRFYSSAVEQPYIEGVKKSLRLQQAEDLYPCLPGEQKAGALQFQQLLKRLQPIAIDAVVAPGEEIPFLPGAHAIDTPGHMPGHLSLYLPGLKTLVAADALVYEQEAFDIANPQYTLDLPAAIESVRKLQQLDIDTVVCYHGGVVRGGIAESLRQLLARYERK